MKSGPNEQRDGGVAAVGISIDQSAPTIPAMVRNRVCDFLELAKFRLSLLVLVVGAAGYCLGAPAEISLVGLGHTIIGIALVAFAANTFNQVIEREFDAKMHRTRNRPLPSGRVSVSEALVFAGVCAAVGILWLDVFTNTLAASIAALTLFTYVWLYTPAKRVTAQNTLIGAIPGALPPVIGFAAAAGSLSIEAALLFVILYFWQMPHFYAIAWMYREDYARGGYRMLSVTDPTGLAISRQSLLYMGLLVLATLLPAVFAGWPVLYLCGAGSIGFWLGVFVVRFATERTHANARAVLLASIAYLPVLVLLLLMTRSAA
ncbi:MAG: protoheme IX farnesyltransferase [Phycisphaerales bacterium]|nr:protoheme IX farnesyltransferase [Phycisphaerales bacterium]MCB9854273.1 protoheme IX farnesyltransferase [Phycisphaerales bacterium]